MVHDDSHNTFRASAVNSSRRVGSMGILLLRRGAYFGWMLASGGMQEISNSWDIPPVIGIKYQGTRHFAGFIPMHPLDAIDRKILSQLQSDSRTTMHELADKVGLSISPCHRRVKLLEERGVITRYIA